MRRQGLLRSAALVGALVFLCALLAVLFTPRNVLSVLRYPMADNDFGVLAVGRDGGYVRGSLRSERELITALESSSCVRQVTEIPALSRGDICLFYGDMCAVISPRGSFVYTASGDGGRYTILNADSQLYPRVHSLLDFEEL